MCQNCTMTSWFWCPKDLAFPVAEIQYQNDSKFQNIWVSLPGIFSLVDRIWWPCRFYDCTQTVIKGSLCDFLASWHGFDKNIWSMMEVDLKLPSSPNFWRSVCLLTVIFLVNDSDFEENKCVDYCKQEYKDLSTGISTYNRHIKRSSWNLIAAAPVTYSISPVSEQ